MRWVTWRFLFVYSNDVADYPRMRAAFQSCFRRTLWGKSPFSILCRRSWLLLNTIVLQTKLHAPILKSSGIGLSQVLTNDSLWTGSSGNWTKSMCVQSICKIIHFSHCTDQMTSLFTSFLWGHAIAFPHPTQTPCLTLISKPSMALLLFFVLSFHVMSLPMTFRASSPPLSTISEPPVLLEDFVLSPWLATMLEQSLSIYTLCRLSFIFQILSHDEPVLRRLW